MIGVYICQVLSVFVMGIFMIYMIIMKLQRRHTELCQHIRGAATIVMGVLIHVTIAVATRTAVAYHAMDRNAAIPQEKSCSTRPYCLLGLMQKP